MKDKVIFISIGVIGVILIISTYMGIQLREKNKLSPTQSIELIRKADKDIEYLAGIINNQRKQLAKMDTLNYFLKHALTFDEEAVRKAKEWKWPVKEAEFILNKDN